MNNQAADLFSGLGGFTEGARQAGIHVELAANHKREAVQWHEINHPNTVHLCQDVMQMDMGLIPEGGLLLASPCCQGLSTNGNASRKHRPQVAEKHRLQRNTSWSVIQAADVARPERIIVENVTQLLDVGCPSPAWKMALEAFGYAWRRTLSAPVSSAAARTGFARSSPRACPARFAWSRRT